MSDERSNRERTRLNQTGPDKQTTPTTASPTREQVRRWRRYLAEERMEQRTYLDLAKRRSGEEKEILIALAQAEKRHEEHWLKHLGERATPAPRPPLTAIVLATLARIFGSIFVLALAQRSEQRQDYDEDNDASAQMAADEHIHGEVVRALAARSREKMSGMFRAAVFGANDGLVSNLALTLGVAATGTTQGMVLAAGTAGLLAGALSMAAGEYISVTSQRELLEASNPAPDVHRAVASLDVEANELELVFRARGQTPAQAAHNARLLFEAQNAAASMRSLTAVGTANHEAVGTALSAAASSFLFFAVGALLPLLPFIFTLSGTTAIIVSATIVGLALLLTGGIVGILSGKPPLARALRQLAIGYGAALITYLLGLAFGANAVG